MLNIKRTLQEVLAGARVCDESVVGRYRRFGDTRSPFLLIIRSMVLCVITSPVLRNSGVMRGLPNVSLLQVWMRWMFSVIRFLSLSHARCCYPRVECVDIHPHLLGYGRHWQPAFHNEGNCFSLERLVMAHTSFCFFHNPSPQIYVMEITAAVI